MNRIVFIYLLLSLSFIYCSFCSWPQWHMLIYFFCYDIGSIVLSHYHHPLSCTLHVVDSIERTLWRLTTSKVHTLGLKLAWRLENTSSKDEQLHLSLSEEIFLLISKYGKDKQERGSLYWFTDKKIIVFSAFTKWAKPKAHSHRFYFYTTIFCCCFCVFNCTVKKWLLYILIICYVENTHQLSFHLHTFLVNDPPPFWKKWYNCN